MIETIIEETIKIENRNYEIIEITQDYIGIALKDDKFINIEKIIEIGKDAFVETLNDFILNL